MRVSTMAIGLAATAAVGTGLAAVALAFPTSPPARFANLAGSLEAEAHALASSPGASPADLARARSATLRSLSQAPANPTAWLRLAFLDSRDGDGLGAEGIDALSRSYAVAPYGPDDTGWRLRFAFNHWTRLDRDTRLMALDEFRVALGRQDGAVQDLPADVVDPAGRLAMVLTLADFRRQAARDIARG